MFVDNHFEYQIVYVCNGWEELEEARLATKENSRFENAGCGKKTRTEIARFGAMVWVCTLLKRLGSLGMFYQKFFQTHACSEYEVQKNAGLVTSQAWNFPTLDVPSQGVVNQGSWLIHVRKNLCTGRRAVSYKR